MLNIEKYKDFVLENINCCKLKSGLQRDGVKIVACHDVSCTECKERCFKWLMEEYKEPILDKAEKAYLSAVIKPFRKRIRHITILKTIDGSKQFVRIDLYDGDYASFPNFKANTMYKGMKPREHYSLEELGL